MTLSMAVKHPFGYFKNVPSFEPVQEAILFCCDSRVSSGHGHSDDCQKLFKLSMNSGLVCAGDARGHLLAIYLIKQRLSENNIYTTSEIIQTIRDCYSESIARGSNSEMLCLFGVFDHETKRARLFRLKSSAGIVIDEIVNHEIHCIGPENDLIEWYGYAFTDHVDQSLKRGSISDNQLEWLAMMAIPFEKQFIGQQWSKYVGGIVQTAVLNESGFHMINRSEIVWNQTHQDFELIRETIRHDGRWEQSNSNQQLFESTLDLDEMIKRFI